MTGWVAAAALGASVWLLFPPGPVVRRTSVPLPISGGRSGSEVVGARVGSWSWAASVAVVSASLVLWLDGTTLALGLIAVVAGAGAWQLVVRGRQRRAARERADRVVEVCEVLAGELRAGQPPVSALRHCVEAWPEMAAVASAAELGGDVPRALRRLSALPGASGLGDVAGAWQVSQTSGGTMALALARVADAARRRRSTQQVVAAELASAQATARLVAVLPVGVLAMGSGFGGDPWAFLLTTPLGLACLGAGLGLALLGLGWIERISATAGAP